jgi:hypothetical protein
MAQTKKLSVATVYGKINPKTVLDATEPIKVMRVIGQAVGTKSGESNYGAWTCLVGQFKATNPETGETSEAAVLFLPDVALVPLQVALAQGDTKGVAFAIDIFVKAATNTKPGGSVYEYSFENVLPPAENDPIRQLEEKIASLALPAPTHAAEAEKTALPAHAGKGSKGGK